MRHESDPVLRNLFLSPYRCEECDYRFWKLSARFRSRARWAGVFLLVAVAAGGVISMLFSGHTPPAQEFIAGGSERKLTARAKSGDAEAAYQLAYAYKEGRGVIENTVESTKWFRTAAELGHAQAQLQLGLLYKAGRGALQNFPEAVKWFEKAALQNNADGQYQLGLMYKAGLGTATDNVKGYLWLNLAAAQGHHRAAEARDALMLVMTPTQIEEAQRSSNAWQPMSSNNKASPPGISAMKLSLPPQLEARAENLKVQ